MDKMADKHSLSYDVRELKLGASFTNNKASQYHTIKCKFISWILIYYNTLALCDGALLDSKWCNRLPLN